MKILSIETSAAAAGTAIVEDGKLIAEFFVNLKLTHSQTLMPMVESMLKCAMISPDEIDVYAVSCGPGSFTGVRIGIAAVKGMAMANGKPCVAVSSLHALARNLIDIEEAVISPVMDARCSQFYNALFEVKGGKLTRLCEDRALSQTEICGDFKKFNNKLIFLVGDGAKLCYNNLDKTLTNVKVASEALLYQKASSVAFAAEQMLINGEGVSAFNLVPKYLRLPQAERNLKIKMQKESER